jgi:hypothetical protein
MTLPLLDRASPRQIAEHIAECPETLAGVLWNLALLTDRETINKCANHLTIDAGQFSEIFRNDLWAFINDLTTSFVNAVERTEQEAGE